MELNLKRLILVPASLDMLKSEIESTTKLAEKLDVQKPFDWPPPLNDEHSQKYFLDYLNEHPDEPQWCLWYFIFRNQSDHKNILIGNGGFKGKPDAQGDVEIGYSIIELYQQRGFASEAAAGLIDWAFKNEQVKSVSARTLVGLRPSIRVLEKNHFVLAGNTKEEGVIRFILKRDNYFKIKNQGKEIDK